MRDLDGAQLGGRRLGDHRLPALQAQCAEVGQCTVAQGDVRVAPTRREAGRAVDHHVTRVGDRAGRGKLELRDLDGAQLGGRRLGNGHPPALQAQATEIGLCPVAQGNVGMAGPRREAGRDVDHHVARVGDRAGRGKLEQRDLDGAQLGVRRLGNRHQPALQAEATEIGLCPVAQGNVGVASVGREAGRRVDRKVAGAGDSVAGRHVQGAGVGGSQADRTAVDQADRFGSDVCGRALERRPAALERSADQFDLPVDYDLAAAQLQSAAGRSGDVAVDQHGVVADQLQRPGRCPVDVGIRLDD